MPRLSLYREEKQNDYRFLDRNISEQLTVGGTDLYIHKYAGPLDQGPSTDFTQPQYDAMEPTNIQDLLFLENRDRKYEKDIYRLRGHYSVQNLDFDLSQFGLFLSNDTIFINVHYNDMMDILGRKMMVGDVIELPHLLDYDPLNDDATLFPTALKRFYQVTDANFGSEGFAIDWYPHLWRIKCEKLVDSQEFQDILRAPDDIDNYLGDWDKNKTYPAGYVMTFGDKNYLSLQDVPVGTKPNATNPDLYWVLDTGRTLKDVLGRYNENIRINDANLKEAARIVPKAGYDTSDLYVVPGYGIYEANNVLSNKLNQPAPPTDVRAWMPGNSALSATGEVITMKSDKYKNESTGIRIPKEVMEVMQIKHGEQGIDLDAMIEKFVQATLSIAVESPEMSPTGSGSGAVEGTKLLTVNISGPVVGPYGTADNTYATADQDPVAPGFTGTEPYGPNTMDYRADCDPRFQFIARATPRDFGYTTGYLSGDGTPPNGLPSGAGISFPSSPQVGDYFLRIDYTPNVLYRWSGTLWLRVSEDVRTTTGYTAADTSQLSGFINNEANIFVNNDGANVSSAQPLSSLLNIAPDANPPSDGT
tara:strand:- start:1004 stop:2767 length:1764 start_codon:yes stop_codon:yes gene_type:complete